MISFYYVKDGVQEGPITIDKLMPFEIKGDTLIWHDGLLDWTPAKEINEFQVYLNQVAPPLPRKPPSIPSNRKQRLSKRYDLTYKGNAVAVAIGFALLIADFIMVEFFSGENLKISISILIGFASLNIVTRILTTIWVSSIARMQNRNMFEWGVFGFISSPIALIIIGFLRRKKIVGQKSFSELKSIQNSRYDKNYFSDDLLTYGCILLIVIAIPSMIINLFIVSYDEYIVDFPVFSYIICTTLIRGLIFYFINNLCNEQNRKKIKWFLFSLIFPFVTLLILSISKRLVSDGMLPMSELKNMRSKNYRINILLLVLILLLQVLAEYQIIISTHHTH